MTKKTLKNTIASLALAGMSLFAGIKSASANTEEYSPAEKEKIAEMAKTLNKNTVLYDSEWHAADFIRMQKILPEQLGEFMKKNSDQIDFSVSPKFSVKETGSHTYIEVDDDSHYFGEIRKDGRITETNADSATVMHEAYGTTIKIDSAKKTFSMEWAGEGYETKSPTVSYAAKTQARTLTPMVKKGKTME